MGKCYDIEEPTYSVHRLIKFDGEGSLKAFCDVDVNGLRIKGLRVIEGKNGVFVSMPRQQGKDGRWYDTVSPTSKVFKDRMEAAVLTAYNEEGCT